MRGQLQIADLIELAVIESDRADEHLSTVYEWRYQHLLGTSKALAGAGSAIALTALVPAVQYDPGTVVNWFLIWIALAAAGVLLIAGAAVYSTARSIHIEFVHAHGLLSELVSIRPFLRRYREEVK